MLLPGIGKWSECVCMFFIYQVQEVCLCIDNTSRKPCPMGVVLKSSTSGNIHLM